MTQPQGWECELYEKVLTTLQESGRTDSSYYVLTQECVRLCQKIKEQPKWTMVT